MYFQNDFVWRTYMRQNEKYSMICNVCVKMCVVSSYVVYCLSTTSDQYALFVIVEFRHDCRKFPLT